MKKLWILCLLMGSTPLMHGWHAWVNQFKNNTSNRIYSFKGHEYNPGGQYSNYSAGWNLPSSSNYSTVATLVGLKNISGHKFYYTDNGASWVTGVNYYSRGHTLSSSVLSMVNNPASHKIAQHGDIQMKRKETYTFLGAGICAKYRVKFANGGSSKDIKVGPKAWAFAKNSYTNLRVHLTVNNSSFSKGYGTATRGDCNG